MGRQDDNVSQKDQETPTGSILGEIIHPKESKAQIPVQSQPYEKKKEQNKFAHIEKKTFKEDKEEQKTPNVTPASTVIRQQTPPHIELQRAPS